MILPPSAGREHWFWGGLLPNDLFNATVFVEPKRYAETKCASVEEFYRKILSTSHLLHKCLNGNLKIPVRMCDASCYYDRESVGFDFIKVGEASLAIDPLSSQGIQTAMQNAAQGATVVHTLLARPQNSSAAIEFYQTKQFETARQFSKTASEFYAEQKIFGGNAFWQKRSQNGDAAKPQSEIEKPNSNEFCPARRLRLAEGVDLIKAPVIERDFVRYSEALKHRSLKNPVAYFGGSEIGLLLPQINGELTGEEIMRRWAELTPSPESLKILNWLWSRNLIIAD